MASPQQDLDALYALIDNELDENGWPIPEISREIAEMSERMEI